MCVVIFLLRQQEIDVESGFSPLQYVLLRQALKTTAISLNGAYHGTVAADDKCFWQQLQRLCPTQLSQSHP
jgi:hypothetical protein